MEKLQFDNETFIWKKKLNLSYHKNAALSASYDVINAEPNNTRGGYSYRNIWDTTIKNKTLDTILQIGLNECEILAMNTGIEYNHINFYSWVNVILSKTPIQSGFKYKELTGMRKYHTHTEINKKRNTFYPHYTYVYYIQMPNVMDGDDGALYFKSKDGIEHWIRPEEDDLIIMGADIPHAPMGAPKSTIDRIVLAANVGFDLIKNKKSIM